MEQVGKWITTKRQKDWLVIALLHFQLHLLPSLTSDRQWYNDVDCIQEFAINQSDYIY